jgi:hypothetical protein
MNVELHAQIARDRHRELMRDAAIHRLVREARDQSLSVHAYVITWLDERVAKPALERSGKLQPATS